jgi:hypothetical protein
MKYLTRHEFESRFRRRPSMVDYDGLYRDLRIDRDAVLTGAVQGSLFIEGGSHVLVTGMVGGSVHVSPEAVLWVEGLVDGRVWIDGGAAFLNGMCSARGNRSAVAYDPSEPAGSETGD